MRELLQEKVGESDRTKAEDLARKVYETAMAGSVPAMRLMLDRLWPAPNRHEVSGSLEVAAMQREIEAAASELDRILRDAAPSQ